MDAEAGEVERQRARRRRLRAGIGIGTAVLSVAVVLVFEAGLLKIPRGWLPELEETRRLTSPDGRTDLVLTWRGGGGAAGWTEESVGFEPHGSSTGDGDELATFDPDALVEARWLSNNVAELVVEELESGSPPTTVRVGGRLVTLKVSLSGLGRGTISGVRVPMNQFSL